MYLSGNAQLYLGDCLKILPQLETESIDLTITSPPYDNLRSYDGYIDAFQFEPIANELFRVTKSGGAIVWIIADATIKGCETLSSFKQALYFKSIGFNVETMIYEVDGTGAKGSNYYYWQSFEYMFILSKGAIKVHNLIRDKKNIAFGTRKNKTPKSERLGTRKMRKNIITSKYGIRTNIWRYHVGQNGGDITEHPAPFPEALARDHILSWSNSNDIIFDPMMGSGTVGKMAIKHNRSFIGIEINPKYFAIAQRRIDIAMKLQPSISLFEKPKPKIHQNSLFIKENK